MECKCSQCSLKSHRDLGFTDEEFFEIVDFYRVLIDHGFINLPNPIRDPARINLLQILRERKSQLVDKQKQLLLEELKRKFLNWFE